VLLGLPAVGDWIIELASSFHGAVCAGLDAGNIKRKISTLRVNLSHRHDDTGTLKVEYEVIARFGTKHMLARCDVRRADFMPADPSRKLPGDN